MELLGVGLAGDSALRMAYLCYHLPRRPTPDIVGWKDLVWAGREQRDRRRPALWGAFLEDWTASVCTTFVQRRAVEPRSGRSCAYRTTEKKILRVLCWPSEGRSLTGFSRMSSEPNLFSRQNSVTLGGFSPLRGSDSAAHSAL